MKTPYPSITEGKPLPRSLVVSILQTALETEEPRFARLAALDWLEAYPGDMEVEMLLAQAWGAEGKFDKALPILKKLVHTDPQFRPAQEILAGLSNKAAYAAADVARACVVALGGKVHGRGNTPNWGAALRQAREALQAEDYPKAEAYLLSALSENPATPLAAELHLQLAQEHYDWTKRRKLAEAYHTRWPDSMTCRLYLAEVWMDGGQENQAVALLHSCAVDDVNGQAPSRLWGPDHPYKRLWPVDLQKKMDLPIPAAVAAALGLNRLASGGGGYKAPDAKENGAPPQRANKPHTAAKPETVRSVQGELARLASRLKKPQFGQSDGRFPIYVILSTRAGLTKQFGQANFPAIERAIQTAVEANEKVSGWSSIAIYADDPDSTSKFGLGAAKADDPWAIKNLLGDLDDALAKRGEMIGALLIVGGPSVVPFHNLPNPVDDEDREVASDNPYATKDENYFVPLWPIGRLPGGGSDPKLLLASLLRIAQQRRKTAAKKTMLNGWWPRIRGWFRRNKRLGTSFGYTAEIWQRASHSVYRVIGEPRSLAISPPVQAERLPKQVKQALNLSYYNLHGLEDTPEWYGQRDPLESQEGPDYPIALRPQDVINGGRAPQFVFSEACFGAHVLGKTAETSLALKFLSSGSQAVVGSTCTSYGSISTPLIGADLLGQAYWKMLNEGYPAGEALRRAKVYVAREMHRRQGYLDGEDQKTLIQFVLYGDPLAVPDTNAATNKGMLRARQSGIAKMVCDRANGTLQESRDIPKEVMSEVRGIVKEYLPGMQNAAIRMSEEHTECTGHLCPNIQIGAKSHPQNNPQRRVVTLSKHFTKGSQSHPQYARLTFDNKGRVVKLVVSR